MLTPRRSYGKKGNTCEDKTVKCDKITATSISSAEIHITCNLMLFKTGIIHDNNEKTRSIYTKMLMNQIPQW